MACCWAQTASRTPTQRAAGHAKCTLCPGKRLLTHMSGCSGSAAPACPLQAVRGAGRTWAGQCMYVGMRAHAATTTRIQRARRTGGGRRHTAICTACQGRAYCSSNSSRGSTCVRHGQVRPVGQALLNSKNDFVVGARKKCAPRGADGVIPDAAIRVDHRAACDVRCSNLRRRGGKRLG